MAFDLDRLDPAVSSFLTERHLATITTLRADGTPHVVPVGFAYDPDERVVRVITNGDSQKVANVERRGRAVVSQVDGRRWLTLEGEARVERDPDDVARAEAAYEQRYQAPRERPGRVAIVIAVDRIMGKV
ncbi:PPOX class probable F420-dependent enzyme [Ilumatobacter fluminis]|uniref:PPOX class probable F420-dependent enzyme n=1 Tax=Ilumatobacter fluminis TaxID=467091 RepID=A0A4R7I5E1_9ACTN|nr:TIGR03618 family F420-dependent PPOX class oxidoreductase [Ilumatobacter fluminis]TDT17996.1 PPOX class probable F420-dependent enzyme [Ilumatobacter fluminis]